MLAGGGPGACTNVALALNDARWPFRAYKPVENILPCSEVRPEPHGGSPSPRATLARRHPAPILPKSDTHLDKIDKNANPRKPRAACVTASVPPARPRDSNR